MEKRKAKSPEAVALANERRAATKAKNALTTERRRKQIAAKNAVFKSAPPVPPTFRAAADHEEPRIRRVPLLLRPSQYKAVAEIAYRQRKSLNTLVSEALELYIKKAVAEGEI